MVNVSERYSNNGRRAFRDVVELTPPCIRATRIGEASETKVKR
jgi:hypothetical protein